VILGTSRAVRVFAYPAPVDLRKGYDGLCGLARPSAGRPRMGSAQRRAVPVRQFVNQSRRLCKVLVWDGIGLWIFQKRLERGNGDASKVYEVEMRGRPRVAGKLLSARACRQELADTLRVP
jgi:IS66 Orf2 like protein